MGNKLAITFEIKWEDADSYDKLYRATNTAIQDGLTSLQWWCETTSFYLVETNENSLQFLTRVVSAARLRPAKDKFVVINLNGQGATAWGALQDFSTLKHLLSVIQKVG